MMTNVTDLRECYTSNQKQRLTASAQKKTNQNTHEGEKQTLFYNVDKTKQCAKIVGIRVAINKARETDGQTDI